MKTRVWLMVAAAIVSAGIFWQGSLEADALGTPKVAVVDVTRALENSEKHQAWTERMDAEQERIRGEIRQMRDELESLEQQLRMLRRGSADYIRYAQEFTEKRAVFEARNSFYEDKMTAEMQHWTEGLYRELLEAVDRVAQQKGVDLVLAKEQLDLPAPSLRDFMLTLKTRKVLYNDDRLDITAEVLAVLDSQ